MVTINHHRIQYSPICSWKTEQWLLNLDIKSLWASYVKNHRKKHPSPIKPQEDLSEKLSNTDTLHTSIQNTPTEIKKKSCVCLAYST